MSEEIDFNQIHRLLHNHAFGYPTFDSIKRCSKCGANYEHSSPFKVYEPLTNLMLRRCTQCNAEWHELAKDGSAPFMMGPKDLYVGDLLLANSILTVIAETGIDNNKTLLKEIESLKKENANLKLEKDKAIGDFISRKEIRKKVDMVINATRNRFNEKHHLINSKELWRIMEPLYDLFDELDGVEKN